MASRKKPPVRDSQKTTLTISLPRSLKDRIDEEAERDHRNTSSWCVKQLADILDDLEAKRARKLGKLQAVETAEEVREFHREQDSSDGGKIKGRRKSS